MKKILLILLMIFVAELVAGDLPAYKIYDNAGKDISFADMVEELLTADVVFFGELHDNSLVHWLELQLTKELYNRNNGKLQLGAEMFEADNQLIIDEYMQGIIKTRHFEENCRLWPNYATDYKPLLEFARQNVLTFTATNIPRRYAGFVASNGLSELKNLSQQAKEYIAPLPIEYDPGLSCYKKMTQMNGMPHAMKTDFLPQAQAAKDATMAFFVSQTYKDGNIFLHFNGRYHSDYNESIIWYLSKFNPVLKVKTITSTLNENLQLPPEDRTAADYIIVTPESITRTYE